MPHSPLLDPNIRSCHKGNVLKISALDVAVAVTGRSKGQCNVMIQNSLSSVDHGEKARRVLWDKHQFTGMGQRPTYVFTVDEAMEFMDCLPGRYTNDVK
eukprot:1334537-Rhodomonas_salina.1